MYKSFSFEIKQYNLESQNSEIMVINFFKKKSQKQKKGRKQSYDKY
jgi:hypothetical protein